MAKRTTKPPPQSAAYTKFIASMEMNYEKWHDGEGYDLEALAALEGKERGEVEQLLRGRQDWRDQEALAVLASPTAFKALEANLRSPKAATRLAAAAELHERGRLPDIGPAIVDVLKIVSIDDSVFSKALDLVGWHKPKGVIRVLLDIARNGPGQRACNAVGMLFYLKGLADEPFDWNHRPFFLRFNDETPKETEDRKAAYKELCAKIGEKP